MTTPTLDTLGSRVLYLLGLCPGLTLEELEGLAGLKSKGHASQIARGAKLAPSGTTLVKLARVLGASVEWLVEGGDAPSERRVRRAVKAARARVEGGGGHARAVRTASRPSKRARRAAGGA